MIVVVVAALLGVSVHQLGGGFDDAPVEPATLCATGESRACFRRQAAIVEANPYEQRIRVSYGAARRETQDVVSPPAGHAG